MLSRRHVRDGHERRSLGLRQRAARARGHGRAVPHRHARRSTNGAYREFVDAGGYDDPRLWTDAGWAWRNEAALERRSSGSAKATARWSRRAFRPRRGRSPLDEPVQHVCWYEADAYARWSGSASPPKPNGRSRRRGRRRAERRTCGATAPHRFATRRTSAHAAARPAREQVGRATRCSATCGSGPRPTSAPIPASCRSRTASTRRSSSAPSTRCCAAGRGPRTRRDAHDVPQLGLPHPPPDLRRLPLRAGRLTPSRPCAATSPTSGRRSRSRRCCSTRRTRWSTQAAARRAPDLGRRQPRRLGRRLVRRRRGSTASGTAPSRRSGTTPRSPSTRGRIGAARSSPPPASRRRAPPIEEAGNAPVRRRAVAVLAQRRRRRTSTTASATAAGRRDADRARRHRGRRRHRSAVRARARPARRRRDRPARRWPTSIDAVASRTTKAGSTCSSPTVTTCAARASATRCSCRRRRRRRRRVRAARRRSRLAEVPDGSIVESPSLDDDVTPRSRRCDREPPDWSP